MGLRGSPEVARRTGPPESIFGDVDFRLRQKKHFTHKICDIVLNFERLYSQKRYLNRWNQLNPVFLHQNDRYIKQMRGIQSKSTAGEKKTETKSNVAQKSVCVRRNVFAYSKSYTCCNKHKACVLRICEISLEALRGDNMLGPESSGSFCGTYHTPSVACTYLLASEECVNTDLQRTSTWSVCKYLALTLNS